jgi:hypothetical protein
MLLGEFLAEIWRDWRECWMLLIGNTWNIIILYTFWIYIYECNILYTYFSVIIKLMNIFIKVLKIINQNFSMNSGPSTFPPI